MHRSIYDIAVLAFNTASKRFKISDASAQDLLAFEGWYSAGSTARPYWPRMQYRLANKSIKGVFSIYRDGVLCGALALYSQKNRLAVKHLIWLPELPDDAKPTLAAEVLMFAECFANLAGLSRVQVLSIEPHALHVFLGLGYMSSLKAQHGYYTAHRNV